MGYLHLVHTWQIKVYNTLHSVVKGDIVKKIMQIFDMTGEDEKTDKDVFNLKR